MPPEEIPLVLWLAELAARVSPGTLRVYFASVTRLSRECGFPDITADFHLVKQAMSGATKSLHALTRVPRKPVSCELLRSFLAFLSLDRHNDAMVWAAMTSATMCLLRSGEFTVTRFSSEASVLRVGSLAFSLVDGYLTMRILLRDTKTAKGSRNSFVYVSQSFGEVCAVSAMLNFLAIRRRRGFLRDDEALFVFHDGSPLTQAQIVRILRTLLSVQGISTVGYSGHSFRIGGASELARAGFSVHEIQLAGRWASSSFLRYIRTSKFAVAKRARVFRS